MTQTPTSTSVRHPGRLASAALLYDEMLSHVPDITDLSRRAQVLINARRLGQDLAAMAELDLGQVLKELLDAGWTYRELESALAIADSTLHGFVKRWQRASAVGDSYPQEDPNPSDPRETSNGSAPDPSDGLASVSVLGVPCLSVRAGAREQLN